MAALKETLSPKAIPRGSSCYLHSNKTNLYMCAARRVKLLWLCQQCQSSNWYELKLSVH